jgi:hypothetical protein
VKSSLLRSELRVMILTVKYSDPAPLWRFVAFFWLKILASSPFEFILAIPHLQGDGILREIVKSYTSSRQLLISVTIL